MPKIKKLYNQTEQEDFTLRAYEGIRRMLLFNEFGPGQKINYREVADQLNMSPTPVIQALKWLEFLGLVRHETNRGFFMAPFSITEINEIFELRKTLEVDLLNKNIDHLTEESLERIRLAVEAYREAHNQGFRKQRSVAAMNFHLAVASIVEAPISKQILRNLFDFIYLKYQVDIVFSRPSDQGVNNHMRIYEYIAARDREGACRALEEDIGNVQRNVVESIEKSIAEKENLKF
jgi:DNA-binding GntR family transcriptional regulator